MVLLVSQLVYKTLVLLVSRPLYIPRLWHCSQFNKDNSKENTHLLLRQTFLHQTRTQKCLDVPPPDWQKTTILHVFSLARIVPSLQFAKTEDNLKPYTYTYTFRARSRIFLRTAFFARHYSLPSRQPNAYVFWLVVNNLFITTFTLRLKSPYGWVSINARMHVNLLYNMVNLIAIEFWKMTLLRASFQMAWKRFLCFQLILWINCMFLRHIIASYRPL